MVLIVLPAQLRLKPSLMANTRKFPPGRFDRKPPSKHKQETTGEGAAPAANAQPVLNNKIRRQNADE